MSVRRTPPETSALTGTPRAERVAALARRSLALRDRVLRLVGLRDELRRRDAALMRDVGLAKGRLDRKPRMDEALHRLQAAVHERTVGAFARLLTAIAADVLPEFAADGGPRIALELGTERGQPSLDVEVDRSGAREDLLDGTGGSLINVVSAGLRFAALARSSRRLFCALDEPDCWIAPERIPAFAGVLGQMAREIGVQCLIISHHDPAAFDGLSSVVHLTRDRDGGLTARTWVEGDGWADGQPGLRHIRLRHYRSHTDTLIRLGPGVTVLTGVNNLGKSTVLSALRSLTQGSGKDDVIAHGADATLVEVAVDGGRRVTWERVRRGERKMRWRLLDADGGVLRETPSGKELRGAPDWVVESLGIAPVDGLDVQIGQQKAPIFLLDQPASRRAQVLSVGRESGLLAAMMAEHGERVRRDREIERAGEAELSRVRARLSALDALDAPAVPWSEDAGTAQYAACPAPSPGGVGSGGLAATVHCLQAQAAALTDRAAALGTAHAAAESLRQALDRAATAHRAATTLHRLPAAPVLPADRGGVALAAALRRTAARARGERAKDDALARLPTAPTVPQAGAAQAADGVRAVQRVAESARRIAAVLGALPAAPAGWEGADQGMAAGRLREAAGRVAEARRAATVIADTIAAAAAERHGLVDALGGRCPLCGGSIGPDGHAADSRTGPALGCGGETAEAGSPFEGHSP